MRHWSDLDAYRDAGVFEETLFVFLRIINRPARSKSHLSNQRTLSGFSVHNYARMLTFE